jgi:hypothetical protein
MDSLGAIASSNFHTVKESARTDERGRLTLGSVASSTTFHVLRNEYGQILLDPVVQVPERELRIWQDSNKFASLSRAIEQAEADETISLGSFVTAVSEELNPSEI